MLRCPWRNPRAGRAETAGAARARSTVVVVRHHVPGRKPASRRARSASSMVALTSSARSLGDLGPRQLGPASASGRPCATWASGRWSDSLLCNGAAASVLAPGSRRTIPRKTVLPRRRSRANAVPWTKARSPPWMFTLRSLRPTGTWIVPRRPDTNPNQPPIPLTPNPAREVMLVATSPPTLTLPPATATVVTPSPHRRCLPRREKLRENPQRTIVTAVGDVAPENVSDVPRMGRSGSSPLYLLSLDPPQTPNADPRLVMYRDRHRRRHSRRQIRCRGRNRRALPGEAARLIWAWG